MKDFLIRKVKAPIVQLLKQGASVNSIAWALAVGIGIGVVPIIGLSTGLCIVVAALFDLNQVATQIGKWIVYPFQLILIVPFWRLGEVIFRIPHVTLDISEMIDFAKHHPTLFLKTYGATALRGTATWAIVLPIPVFILQIFLKHTLKHMRQQIANRAVRKNISR